VLVFHGDQTPNPKPHKTCNPVLVKHLLVVAPRRTHQPRNHLHITHPLTNSITFTVLFRSPLIYPGHSNKQAVGGINKNLRRSHITWLCVHLHGSHLLKCSSSYRLSTSEAPLIIWLMGCAPYSDSSPSSPPSSSRKFAGRLALGPASFRGPFPDPPPKNVFSICKGDGPGLAPPPPAPAAILAACEEEGKLKKVGHHHPRIPQ